METKKNQEVKSFANILVELVKENDLIKRSMLASDGLHLLAKLGVNDITIDDIDIPDFMKENKA